MTDQSPTDQTATSPMRVHWIPVLVLTILALLGGVWLGRVAFVSNEEAAPRVIELEVEDKNLNASGRVELINDRDILLLTINAMPPPPEGQVYVVWVQKDDVTVRAGIWSPNSREFAFATWNGRYDTLFITAEPGPLGSEQPTSSPLISADLTELRDWED